MNDLNFNSNLINIGGDPNDPFYRYKMESLKTQIVGKGNGIQTILLNIEQVASMIGHPLEIITKYLSYCTGSIWNSSKNSLTGNQDLTTLQEYISQYITSFVLCGGCGNPETSYHIEGKKKRAELFVKCASCGYYPVVKLEGEKCSNETIKFIKGKSNDKLMNFIINYIQKNPMEQSTEKKQYDKESNVLGDINDNIF